jgi:hypothetical protein
MQLLIKTITSYLDELLLHCNGYLTLFLLTAKREKHAHRNFVFIFGQTERWWETEHFIQHDIHMILAYALIFGFLHYHIYAFYSKPATNKIVHIISLTCLS